ncbi:MAG: fibronectin type III domain-containing protein, partial [Bacteroidia bacterium]|nr:fibronectin type III domain-containing protein [Bacteroidia bacterium]
VTRPGCPPAVGTTTVQIFSIPTAPQINTNSPVCLGGTLSLNVNNPITNAVYEWQGPAGFQATGINPTRSLVSSAEAGIYTVKVTVAPCPSVQGFSQPVVVNTSPTKPSVSTNSPTCTNGSLVLSVNSPQNNVTYNWVGPNLNQSGASINDVAPAAAGTYVYSVNALVPGCSPVVTSTTVTVNAPVTSLAYSGDQVVCQGSLLSLTAQAFPSLNNVRYHWAGPNGYISTQQNPFYANIPLSQSGVYTITASTPGCTAIAGNVNVQVNPNPTAVSLISNSPVCVGKELRITASTIVGAIEYLWEGPAGFSQTTAAPLLAIQNATKQNSGIYTVTVKVGGCTNTVSSTISVVVLDPAGTAVTSNAPICAGQELLLEAIPFSNVQNVNYRWSGPNGLQQNTTKLSIRNAPTNFSGIYTLTVEIPGCTTGTQTVNVVINPSPALPFPTSNSPVCVGSELRLTTAVPTQGAFYQWSGPNDFTAFEPNPVISGSNLTTANSGVYTLTVSLGSCSRTGTTNVVVNSGIPSDFSISSNAPLCTTEDLVLAAPVINGASYTWTGPNSFTSTQPSPTIQNINSLAIGTYTLTVNVPGCSASRFTITPTIRITPDLPIITSNSPVCEGGILRLSAVSSLGAQYVWEGPASFTSTLQNPTISGIVSAQAGTYSVTAVIDGCEPRTSSINVVVNPVPDPVITTNSPVCQGSTLNLSVEPINDARYQWQGPGQFSSNLRNPSRANIQTSMAGTYSLLVSVPGCDPVLRTISVVVNLPTPAIQPSSNSPVCQGNILQLSAPNISNATYQWTGPNGFVSTERNPRIESVTADFEGSYSLIVQRQGCPASSGTINVRIITLPSDFNATNNGPVCVGATLNLSATSFGGANYQWQGPAGFRSTEQNPSINGVNSFQAGIYTVTIFVQGCTGATRTTRVTVNSYPANLAINSNAPVCEGGTLTLTAPFVANATYLWEGPEGFTATTPTGFVSSVTTENAGVYSVTLNLPGCGARTLQLPVSINRGLSAITVSNNGPVCEGGILNFTVEGAASNASFNWSGPQGFSASISNPNIIGVTTANSGLYQVAVVQPGCGTTVFNTLAQVNPGVSSFVISSNAPVCEGGTLRLTVPNVAGATYTWSGPANFSSSIPSPFILGISSINEGVYSVTANIPACGVVTDNIRIRVNPSLQGASISSNAPVCEGGVLELSAPIIEGATYRWQGPGGYASTEVAPKITNVTSSFSGIYTLTLSSSGCGIRILQTSVSVVPGNNLTIATNAPVCAGQTLTLSVPSFVGATYLWRGPNNFTSTQSTVVLTNVATGATGTYSVTATIPGCGVVTASRFIAINSTLSNIVASNNGPICAGNQLLLSVNGAPAGATYRWQGPNGFSSTLQSPIISNTTTANSGIYTVTVRSAECGEFNATTTVIVNPEPSSIFALNNGPLCTNGILVLNATFVPGATYSWSGPNDFRSTEPSPRISGVTTQNSGTYNVSILLPGCGLITRTTNVVVSPSLIDLNVLHNSPVCEGGVLNLSVTSSPGATYSWRGPNGFTSSLPNPTISNVSSLNVGRYFVEINSPSCGNIALTADIVVKPGIRAVEINNNSPICEGETLVLSASLQAEVNYSWSGPNNFSSSSVSFSIPNITTASAGIYTLTLSSIGCSAVTTTTVVTINKGSRVLNVSSPLPPRICPGAEVTFEITFAAATAPWQLVYQQVGGPELLQSTNTNPLRLTVLPNASLPLEYTFGCNALRRTVGLQPPLNARLASKQDAVCGMNGSATISVENAGEGISFTLQGTNITNTTGQFANLAPGNYTVLITNNAGCLEAISFNILNETAISAPSITGITTNAVTVTWSLPGGVIITGVEYRAVGTGTGFRSVSVSEGTSSTRITGLLANTLYEFRLVGNCPGSNQILVSSIVRARTLEDTPTSIGICQTPTFLPIEVLSNTSVRLRWVPNESGAACYVISYGLATTPVENWQSFLVTHPLSEVILTGLDAGSRYGFRIRTNCSLCSPRNGIFTPFSAPEYISLSATKSGISSKDTGLLVYPNPSRGIFYLSWEDREGSIVLGVKDITGKTVWEQILASDFV